MSGLSDRKLKPLTNYGHLLNVTPPQFRTSPEEQARLAEEARHFPVTKLPYQGPRRHARVQFRKRKVITTESGLAWTDYMRGMHMEHRSDNAEQWVPEFANNDKDLRLVLAQSSWNYMLKHGRV